MRRVAGPGGIVAAYVWDFAGGRSRTWPLVRALCQIGVDGPRIPGKEDSTLEALASIFEGTGFEQIAVRSIDVTVSFPGFDEFWVADSPFSPIGELVGSL